MAQCKRCDGIGYISGCCNAKLLNVKYFVYDYVDKETGDYKQYTSDKIRFAQCSKCTRMAKRVKCPECNKEGDK